MCGRARLLQSRAGATADDRKGDVSCARPREFADGLAIASASPAPAGSDRDGRLLRGARHLYGEVFCDAIEQPQRDALDEPRPELVVTVDRLALNECHRWTSPCASRSTGVVTVYEGRKEFRELERAARRAGHNKRRVPEYVPYRMLEVEAAANAVYSWAADQILARGLPDERPSDPAEYAAAVRHHAQALRHRAHHKLMQAFLEPEIFQGAVTLTHAPRTTGSQQLRLVSDQQGS